VLGPGLLVQNVVESAWGGAVVLVTGCAAKRPFHPRKGNAQKQEGDEVGDNECATTVCGCLHRESQEVAESDGGTRDSENHAQLRTPVVSRAFHFSHPLNFWDKFSISQHDSEFALANSNLCGTIKMRLYYTCNRDYLLLYTDFLKKSVLFVSMESIFISINREGGVTLANNQRMTYD
jgi:hypothetical protein